MVHCCDIHASFRDFQFSSGRPHISFSGPSTPFDTFPIEPGSTKSVIQGMATPEPTSLVTRVFSMGRPLFTIVAGLSEAQLHPLPLIMSPPI